MSIGMSDELNSFKQRALIKVCGVGGAGGNAIARMIEVGLDDVELIATNPDAPAPPPPPAGRTHTAGPALRLDGLTERPTGAEAASLEAELKELNDRNPREIRKMVIRFQDLVREMSETE